MAAHTGSFAIFPSISLFKLSRMHGRRWMRLVNRVSELPETHPEHMAYTYLMRRLGHQLGTDSNVCVVPGCANCAVEILERYQGNERDLLVEYNNALSEVQAFVTDVRRVARRAVA